MQADQTLSVIDALYASALGERDWADALAQLSSVFNASSAHLWMLDNETSQVALDITHQIDARTLARYQDAFLASCVRTGHLFERPDLPIYYDYLHSSETDLRLDPCYDFYRREVDGGYYVGLAAPQVSSHMVGLSLQRSRRVGHADASELRLGALIQTHFQRAISIALHLNFAQLHHGSNGGHMGFAFVGADGAVLFADEGVTSFAAASDGLDIEGGRLRIADAGAAARIAQDIDAATDLMTASPVRHARRPSGAAPYKIAVTPAPKNTVLPLTHARAMLAVQDVDAKIKDDVARAASGYGLSERETEVAALLLRGLNAKAIAGKIDISRETVRTHTKSIYGKCGVAGHAELITKLSG
ncbi:MAG: helix-turn-helix transcriptional regulator [Pseudomonadota bacterium]